MADTFKFELVTPAAPMISQPVELVIIPGAGGNFGVLPGHAPLLSTLRPGVIEIRDKALAIVDQIFVDGGFAEVTPERTTVLAEEAVRVADLSREDAEARLKRAHDALMVADTVGVRTLAERDLKAAEAMVEAYEAFDKPHGKA
ncbi:ATP synthase F1 subunit epsilon [Defluviicoccus vanus]|uniref:ATP synthase epsilon chain n=1 Tax=Defluviicoccus vanus TaxID=111831 RepID=A0A7H1N3W4_9PROT|nr:ATP synthase F1 subunit epsilon [Defluviicoccus vanus]QNT70400.1 ATP synthase F1 subunit epsilon [Defluviicoccus vanus]